MKNTLCLFAALAIAFMPALWAIAQDEAEPAPAAAAAETEVVADTISGTVTMGGEETALTHGCALRLDNEENYMDGPMLLVLLADQEVSPDLLKSPTLADLKQAVQDRQLRFAFFSIDLSKEDKEVNGMAMAGSPEMPMPASFTLTDAASGLSELTITDERVQASIDRPETEPDPANPMEAPFAMKTTFDLAVSANDPVTAHLTGEEAVNSPQAAAFMGYFDALRNADMEALAKVTSGTEAEMYGQIIAQVGEDAFKERVAQGLPETATFKSQISEVFVRGTRALLMVSVEGQRAPLPLVQEGEAWKVR